MDCSWCERPLPATMEGVAIDHIIPRARGGPNDRWNKQLLHTRCNIEKGDKLTPAAQALARARGVVLREPGGRYRMAQQRRSYTYRPPSEILALQRLMEDSGWAQLQFAINDVNRHIRFTIDAASPVHDYQQLANQLRDRIAKGVISSQLPSYKDLAAGSGLSVSSVQRAVKILVAEGIVTTIRGQGIYVRNARI